MIHENIGVGAYLKAADIDGAVIKRIINVTENTEGKYGPKLDVWFEDGFRLSLSATNVRELQRAYSMDSDLWLDKAVKLTTKEYTNNEGNSALTIVLTAIDSEVPRDQRPKLTTISPPRNPPPKEELPPPKTGNGGHARRDMDDEIPFAPEWR